MTYEDISQFAQTFGLVYFVALFLAGAAYAFWPGNQTKFDAAARIPFTETPSPEDDA